MKKIKRILLVFLPLAAAFGVVWFSLGSRSPQQRTPGDIVDSLDGVYVYYNGSVSHVAGRNTAADGYNLGLKYQCVEFVKRYYYEHYRHKMPDSYGHAKDFFDPSVMDGGLNRRRALVQYANPGKSRPQKGDLVVMDETVFNPYGHVAIVSHVTDLKIVVIQQNPGPSASSRVGFLLRKQTDGTWKVDNDRVLGWLRKED